MKVEKASSPVNELYTVAHDSSRLRFNCCLLASSLTALWYVNRCHIPWIAANLESTSVSFILCQTPFYHKKSHTTNVKTVMSWGMSTSAIQYVGGVHLDESQIFCMWKRTFSIVMSWGMSSSAIRIEKLS